jgi:hypothetical protein
VKYHVAPCRIVTMRIYIRVCICNRSFQKHVLAFVARDHLITCLVDVPFPFPLPIPCALWFGGTTLWHLWLWLCADSRIFVRFPKEARSLDRTPSEYSSSSRNRNRANRSRLEPPEFPEK